MRALGCVGVLATAMVWAIASYVPVGYWLLAGADSDRTPDWLWVGLIFMWYVITPALLLYAAFRVVRPMR